MKCIGQTIEGFPTQLKLEQMLGLREIFKQIDKRGHKDENKRN